LILKILQNIFTARCRDFQEHAGVRFSGICWCPIFRNMLVSAIGSIDAKSQFRPGRASIRAQGDSSRLSSYLDRISGSEYACSFLSSELVGSPVSGASIALDIVSCGFIGCFFFQVPLFRALPRIIRSCSSRKVRHYFLSFC